jgi:hypothetical protein
MCRAEPLLDPQCHDPAKPHVYACFFPMRPPPSCVLLNPGNATDLYCCP